MHYEFLLRILIAGVLGALIGLERERRSKEAGLRTHFLVAVGSAVIMIISKYGFGDILSEDIVLDPSRVAAQVVSGIGFLGAGMIIVQRASIHGLTTAAGIWATAAIGLAIGSGMYEIGVFASLLVIVGLEFLKMIFQPIIPQTYRIVIDATNHAVIPIIIQKLTDKAIKIKDYQVKVNEKADSTIYSIEFKVKSATRWEENELVHMLYNIDDVQSVKFP